MKLWIAGICMVLLACGAAAAQDSGAKAGAPEAYDSFVKSASVSPGLIAIIRKDGKIYLSIPTALVGQDLIETSVPATGLGGFGPAPGEPYVAPARIMRFERADNNVVIRWPNTLARVTQHSPEALGASLSLPNSVVAVTPVVAESASGVVISADPFLGDVANLAAAFNAAAGNPGHTYHLDSARSFFTKAKSFPRNTVLRVSQTWATDAPDTIDVAPDARSIEVSMTYNFIMPPSDGYIPRYADPRVGYFEQPLIDFSSDALSPRVAFNDPSASRQIYYITRWNFMPASPGKPSLAKNPLVFTLNDDVPATYRATITNALLRWNDAFKRIGILDAVKVQQQPDDPDFDVDDIRYNMVSWFDSAYPTYGAEALIVTDPRTGEEINSGVNFDAVAGLEGHRYRYLIAPARGLPDSAALEAQFARDWIASTALHESGHDFGLQHNFIGSMAYTAKELQSRAFTSRYGLATSVMEYSPTNLWPKGTPQGDYNQRVLGPYDYYAIQYGYGYIPNASSPEAEVPALNRLASRWSDPRYRFASDEDAFFDNGHAIDPRVQQDDLTDRPLQWERVQLRMLHDLMNAVNKRFPRAGEPYDEARRAFSDPLKYYLEDVAMPAHVIGGEYVSRANAGDPHSVPPLQPVSRAAEREAWETMETYLFSDSAWHFNPDVLDRLTYSEASINSGGNWAYNPPSRHDVPVVAIAAQAQTRVLDELLAPLTLQRIDDLSTKYKAGTTMSLTDLFDWTRSGLFGDLTGGSIAKAGVVRRNVQIVFAKRLALMWMAPKAGTPTDAQTLARLQLEYLAAVSARALRRGFDEQTRAHVEALHAIAMQGLEARPALAP